MCLVGNAFVEEILLINNTLVQSNWMESWAQTLLTCPWIIKYLCWHRGLFCHDMFVSDEEVGNHINNRHYLYDYPLIFLSKDFQRKGWSDWTYGVREVQTPGISNSSFFVKKSLWVLNILWNTLSITTSADADTFGAVICTYFKLG